MLKQLFMGHQGTLGIATEATLELVGRPECEFSAFFAYDDYMKAYRTTAKIARSGIATLAGVVLFDEWKIKYLRRDDEAYIPQPEVSARRSRSRVYGRTAEVRAGGQPVMELGREDGGPFLGDEISQGDWASRHERYATPQHGRRRDGQVVLMCWHCEDAAIPYSALPKVREEWHAIVEAAMRDARHVRRLGDVRVHQRAFKPWGDYLAEIDIGIWEMQWDDETWAAWVDAKREIAASRSSTAARSPRATAPRRAGEADSSPPARRRLRRSMKTIKRALDPNNIMNPGKQMLDQAYEEAR